MVAGDVTRTIQTAAVSCEVLHLYQQQLCPTQIQIEHERMIIDYDSGILIAKARARRKFYIILLTVYAHINTI